MNPLEALPGSTSPQFSLNGTDAMKVLRMLLVQLAGLVLTIEVPKWLNMNYFFNGIDYTPYVLIGVSALAEVLRRFVAGGNADPTPPSVVQSGQVAAPKPAGVA